MRATGELECVPPLFPLQQHLYAQKHTQHMAHMLRSLGHLEFDRRLNSKQRANFNIGESPPEQDNHAPEM
jgi:hypothetical protein